MRHRFILVAMAVFCGSLGAVSWAQEDTPPIWLNSEAPTATLMVPISEGDIDTSPDTYEEDPGSGAPESGPPPNNVPSVPESMQLEIKSLALALGSGSAVTEEAPQAKALRIFNWVRNNIHYECYNGIKKGSAMTLLEGAANDFDQSILLADLLVAAGYPSSDVKLRLRTQSVRYQVLVDNIGLADEPYPGKTFVQAVDRSIADQFTSNNGSASDNVAKQAYFGLQYLMLQGRSKGNLNTLPSPDYLSFPGKAGLVYDKMCVLFRVAGGPFYELDPSYKVYEKIPATATNLLTAAGYNRAALLTAVGGDVNLNPAPKLDWAMMNQKLDGYAATLMSKLNEDALRNLDLDALIGGRRIIKSEITSLSGASASGRKNVKGRNDVFDSTRDTRLNPYKTKLTFQVIKSSETGSHFANAPFTIYAADLKGRKISFNFTTTGSEVNNLTNKVQLRLDDKLDNDAPGAVSTVDGGTAPTFTVKITIDHPAILGSQKSFSENKTYKHLGGAVYVILYGYKPSGRLLQKRYEQLRAYMNAKDEDGDRMYEDSSMQIRGEILNIMGQTWLYQTELCNRLLAAKNDVIPLRHHRIGRVAQEQGFYIDVGLQFAGFCPSDSLPASSVGIDRMGNTFHVGSLIGSAMEHGIIEQMQPGCSAISTVNVIRKANRAANNPIYLGTPSNWLNIYSQFTGYKPSDMVDFTSTTHGGGRVLLPKNSNVTEGTWSGSGWMIRKEGGAGMVISGNYGGGYFTGGPASYVMPQPLYNSFSYSPSSVYSSSQDNSFSVAAYPTVRNYGADPVDMATGAFEFSAVDMATGIEDAPRGLSFSRNYSSLGAESNSQNMGYGWTHSYHLRTEESTSSEVALGGGSPQMAASFLTAMLISADLYRKDASASEWVAAALTAGWFTDGLKDNSVSVRMGRDVFQFTKQADGSYLPPAGTTLRLTKASDGTFRFKQRLGNTITFDEDGKATEITDVDGRKMLFEYNGSGTIKYVQDSNGRRFTFKYTKDKNISEIKDSTGPERNIQFIYDDHQNLIRVVDPESKNAYYDYSVAGDPGNTVPDEHKLVRLRNHDKKIIIQNVYDDLGRVDRQLLFGSTARTTHFYYTGRDNSEVNPRGGATHYYYDERRRPVGQLDPEGNLTKVNYDSQDRVASRTSATGEVTGYQYDERGNLEKVTLPRGGGSITTKHDGINRIDLVTDQLGNKTKYEYYVDDAAWTEDNGNVGKDRPWKVTRGYESGQAATTIYGYMATGPAIGKVRSIYEPTDTNMLETNMSYDNYGQPDITTLPGGFKIDENYDPRGNLVSVKDAKSVRTSYTYNLRRQVLTETADVGGINAVTTTTYDNQGRQASSKQPPHNNGQEIVSSFTYSPSDKPRLEKLNGITISDKRYDARDWPLAAYDAAGRVTVFERKKNGDLKQSSAPGGRNSSFTYDGDSRLATTTNPGDNSGSRVESFVNDVDPATGWPRTVKTSTDGVTKETSVFDREGKLRYFTDRKNQTFEMRYDALGRKTHVINPSTSLATGEPERSTVTTYGKNDKVRQILEPSQDKAIYAYNGTTGRPQNTLYFGSMSSTVNFTSYDNNGNLLTLNENYEKFYSRTYDNLNRLTSYTAPDPYTAQNQTIYYRYYKNGLLQKIIYPGGSETGIGHVEYTYDANGRLKDVIDRLDSTTSPRTTSYVWKTDGHLESITRPNGTKRTIGYETVPDTGRPNSITETKGSTTLLSWQMDYYPSDDIRGLNHSQAISAGLIAPTPTATLTYDAANRLVTWNGQNTAHDRDGNMTSGPLPKTGALGDFTYDSRNRLITGGGLTYTYDAEGLRTGISGNAGAGAETTSFVIDPSGAMSKLLSRKKNGVTTRYVYGVGLQYEVSSAGVATYYHYDHVGNTAGLTNASGVITDRMTYSPYGALTYRSGTTDTPFLYGGFFGVMTDSNGLLHMRARYYNPLTQRFMNADPARDGWNWYAYADGNPVNWADPSGFGAINTLQATLSIIGFYPGPVGAIANLINGFISMYRGDDAGMIQSFVGAATFGIGSIASYSASKAVGSIATVGYMSKSAASPFTLNAARVESRAAPLGFLGCFIAGTAIATAEGPKAIDTFQVGDRVLTPSHVSSSTGVDPATWHRISVKLADPQNPAGGLRMEMLRSNEWMAEAGCKAGARIWLEIHEMGLSGWAEVERVGPCPEIQKGPGRVVLATMTRDSAPVLELTFQGGGEALHPTPNHPLYSITGAGWTPASSIVKGDVLRTQSGTRTVESVTWLHEEKQVFNLEVETDHCYFVGRHEILSHNSCAAAAKTTARTNFSVYETLAEVPISGTTRGAHRISANNAFAQQLQGSSELQSGFNQLLGKDVLGHMNSGAGRNFLNPPGTVWHHPVDNPGVLQLLRRTEHTNPLLQPVLHPSGIGGFGTFYGP